MDTLVGLVDTDIAKYMHKLLQNYENIRGKSKDSGCSPFWDMVAITTADEDQKNVFEAQIKQKLENKELPLDLPFHVIADPPGPKLGNGGSTFTALDSLHKRYGSKLFDRLILLIHAGGQSQRLPSASILGKIFSPIPHGHPIYQMLDIKLAMYWPLLPRMKAGVFIASADDFLLYNVREEDQDWSFSETGFTALAHPSSVKIGTKHGVYVVENVDKVDRKRSISMARGLEVLQKPTEVLMYQKGAVLKNDINDLATNVLQSSKSNIAYTDSSFYIGMDVVKKLLHYVEENGLITCEIDAYGDFLQALGPRATIDYIYNTSNVSNVNSDLLGTREKIFRLLKGTEINLLLMNSSRFVHIGSTREYIHHFCVDKDFQKELSLHKDIFNNWMEFETFSAVKKAKYSDVSEGCIMHSILPIVSMVSSSAIIEYCHFDVPVYVAADVIISNCQFISNESSFEKEKLEVPSNVFLHTVSICIGSDTKYVTIFFHIDDDMKKTVSLKQIGDLSFMGKTLDNISPILNVDLSKVAPENHGKSTLSLWHANLFPVMDTMSESFDVSLKFISAIKKQALGTCDMTKYNVVSIAECLSRKSHMAMLNYRQTLYKKITL